MSHQILLDLLGHFADYGSYWKYTTGSDFQKLYNFYCLRLEIEPLKIITTRSTLLKDMIAENWPDLLAYQRIGMKYGNRFCPTNCLLFLPKAFNIHRAPFNGLTKQVAINDGAITFVKAPWLVTFYKWKMKEKNNEK